MDWTGSLYFFYTNKSRALIVEDIKNIAFKKYGFIFEDNSFGDEYNFLFYLNEEMLNRHLEHGYGEDRSGKGCFSIESKITNFFGVVSILELSGRKVDTPADTNVFFKDVFYITLILPSDIDNSSFSKSVYGDIADLLKDG